MSFPEAIFMEVVVMCIAGFFGAPAWAIFMAGIVTYLVVRAKR